MCVDKVHSVKLKTISQFAHVLEVLLAILSGHVESLHVKICARRIHVETVLRVSPEATEVEATGLFVHVHPEVEEIL